MDVCAHVAPGHTPPPCVLDAHAVAPIFTVLPDAPKLVPVATTDAPPPVASLVVSSAVIVGAP